MYTVGLDVGSTTIKAVVLDEENNIVYKSYQRHRALIKEKASMMLREVSDFLPIDKKISVWRLPARPAWAWQRDLRFLLCRR